MKTYIIFYKRGVDQNKFYSYVSSVVDQMAHRPTYFLAKCTDSQVEELNNLEDIVKLEDHWHVHNVQAVEVEQATKTVTYHREFNHVQMIKATTSTSAAHPYGNWGLIRHQSQTNNTSFNTTTSSTYSNNYDGTGVDIILNLASVLDRNDPEYMTNGVCRLEQFQWNTLPGLSDMPTVDYSLRGESKIHSHAEGVAYCCASNSHGWATGAALYIWPRDQFAKKKKYTSTHGWDCFKLFHQNKGNNRPTLVIDSIMYINRYTSATSAVLFRNEIYSDLAPGGTEALPGNVYNRMLARTSAGIAYGNTTEMHYDVDFRLFGNNTIADGIASGDARAGNITSTITNALKAYIGVPSNATSYDYWREALDEMEAAGVHHVSAAGNFGNKICLPDNIDYNNGILTPFSLPTAVGGTTTFHNVFNKFVPTCRANFVIGPNTIVAGALGSEFGVHSQFNNKETMAFFSDRGDRVDTCAAGENIYFNMFSNGHYEATGTSFASPNVAGMAACVLQKYPTTTVQQLRKYFRENAVGTDTLYDTGNQPVPSSNKGDLQYFGNPIGLKGYSGKIAYLDPNLTFDPTTISNTSITSTESVSASNIVDHSIAEINTILG